MYVYLPTNFTTIYIIQSNYKLIFIDAGVHFVICVIRIICRTCMTHNTISTNCNSCRLHCTLLLLGTWLSVVKSITLERSEISYEIHIMYIICDSYTYNKHVLYVFADVVCLRLQITTLKRMQMHVNVRRLVDSNHYACIIIIEKTHLRHLSLVRPVQNKDDCR